MNEIISRINENKYSVKFLNESEVKINNEIKEYLIKKVSGSTFIIKMGDKIFNLNLLEQNNSSFEFLINGKIINVTAKTLLQDKAEELITHQSESHSKSLIVKAPMPGLILKIKKSDGDEVKKGETVMILEAMKMENEIRAPISGKISFNSIKEGISIEKNAKLFEIK